MIFQVVAYQKVLLFFLLLILLCFKLIKDAFNSTSEDIYIDNEFTHPLISVSAMLALYLSWIKEVSINLEFIVA